PYRFERGTDWDMCTTASNRAVAMILELAGGELVTDLVDVNSGRPTPPRLTCRFDRIRHLIGANIANERIMKIFRQLSLEVVDITPTQCSVIPPLFRQDLEREADLAEEVARVYGLDNIPVPPVRSIAPASIGNDTYRHKELLRNRMIGLGLCECVHYSLVSEASALADATFQTADLIRLDNPLSLELAFLRPSLFGEMMATVERNISHQNTDLRLFEYGRVFCANPDKYPEERDELCLILTGKRHPELYSAALAEEYDFYDLKGLVESLLEMQRFSYVQFRKIEDGKFDYAAEIRANGQVIGVLGRVASRLTKGLKTKSPVFAAIIQVDAMLALKTPKVLFQSIPQYPSTTRDVAFVAPESLEHRQVIEFIGKAKLKFLEKVELFDIFRDETLGAGKKSMAYKLTFRNPERTLTDNEVNAAFEKLRQRLSSQLQVELR
ncbi:MAG: phenylalanine--tRNA ligase subunit beta, partial [Victivallales bacterium]|nr:phenylalanine--tRNA ligase subunit beta [Victivallales bacterium]